MSRLSLLLSLLLTAGAASPWAHAQEQAERAVETPASAKEKKPRATGKSGAITGRVVDEAGQPMPYAYVSAYTVAASGSSPRLGETTSDEDGKFRLDNFPAGVYIVFAHVPGYVSPHDPFTGSPNMASRHRVGDHVTLTMTKGGVITGAVSDASGNPVIAVRVRAQLVRELDGSPPRRIGFAREFQTDDRGIYRLYGLSPGVYVVSAGGVTQWATDVPSPYETDAPSYSPTGTRDTATEITVRAGQETAGVDIRYRGERGHTVSGRVEGSSAASSGWWGGTQITISHAPTGAIVASQWFTPREADGGFAFEGLADGEYELHARQAVRDSASPGLASKPVRVAVRGADVTGVRLTLAPLAAMKGRVLLVPLAEAERSRLACGGEALLAQEASVLARRDESDETENVPRALRTTRGETAVSAEGEFMLGGLEPGRYRVSARVLSEDWYLRSVTLPPQGANPDASKAAPTTRAPSSSAAVETVSRSREHVALGPGQTVSDLSITLAEGAASLRGRVVAQGGNGASPPQLSQLRVHVVPFVGRERGGDDDNPLRYAEAQVAGDGSFKLTNLAPGRYHVVARPADAATGKPLAWDAAARARLRRDAEASGSSIELQPCQRVADYALNLTPRK